ncbi:hypothetical protein ARMGADRAFT_1085503 [Armillaria gallica]|uniref:Uncharacterized protein n=1 Tax=Armillaria gallica TaxID=47427 RepID=A0A2H3D076_ARMGA|nr:hypothetical protein ARMGADRAFT_1085503 [Armillaria gallica]
MAEPTDPAELAKVQAQDAYNAAAAALDDLLDNFPNTTWDSTKMDSWLIDVVSHWSTCEDNWSSAGVVSKEWYKLEYSLLAQVPDLLMDKVKFARREFNELVERALDYNLDVVPLPVCHAPAKRSKTTASPSQSCQGAATTGSRMVTPTPSKTTTPVPPSTEAQVIESSTAKCVPPPQNVRSSVPRIDFLAASPKAPVPSTPNSGMSKGQFTQPPANKTTRVQQQTTQRKVKPTPITAVTANVAFPPDPTLPLHQKPGTSFRFGPPAHTTGSETSLKSSSSHLLMVNAATRPLVNPGPNPADKGSVAPFPRVYGPLFFPGTDDEEEQVQGDLVEDSRIEDEIAGTDGEDGDVQSQAEEDAQSSDDATSPSPTNMARRLRHEPKISFVFNDTTGDFVESYLTIFLSRPVAPPSQSQDLQRSVRSNTSPVNCNTAYLKTAQSSQSDVTKKKKKDVKGKGQATETKAPRKRARTEDDTTQVKDKLASKKPKLKEIVVIDGDEPAVATKAIHRRGPGLSRLPPVTLGISGGGFGEKVPSSAKVVSNGVQSIGVLMVDNDFGDFVEVNKSYWSKEVAPFVGEHYTTPCDHCRRLGTQCRKLLTHSIKCVNSIPALNPIEYYRPKGYDAVNTFEATINAIEVNNAAVTAITHQYLASLNIFTHTDSIRAQASRLRGCLYPVADEADEEDNEDDGEADAPDDVAEGVAGPSTKKKGRSG